MVKFNIDQLFLILLENRVTLDKPLDYVDPSLLLMIFDSLRELSNPVNLPLSLDLHGSPLHLLHLVP